MSAARRYSESQVAALGVLGLVPWVQRHVAPSVQASPVPVIAPPREPVPAGPAPWEPDAFADWLLPQPLAGFARRGERCYLIGTDEARLLVIAEAAAGEVSLLPLEQTEAELLDLMLRAIELPRAEYAVGVLQAERAGDADEGAPRVAAAVQGRRALLWLEREPAGQAAHSVRLDGVPAFRVSHPARLLEQPLEKRRAWETLKLLRQILLAP